MKKAILTAFLFCFPFAAAAQWESGGQVMPISVYGEDDRKDYFESSRAMRSFAESTVALFRGKDLRFNGEKSVYEITPVRLGEKLNLEKDEKFYSQTAISACSGFLAGKNTVVTAGHCLDRIPCESLKIVFGYAVKKEGERPKTFPAGEVYFCREVSEKKSLDAAGGDYALIKLDREVKNHAPLALNRGKSPAKGTKLFVIGYPSGLPVKIAGNAMVRDAGEDSPYFTADLDTFHGNSGSPVFNAETFLIEGIVADGGKDYRYTIDTPGGLRTVYDPRLPFAYNRGQTHVYEQDGGPGEKTTKAKMFDNLIGVTELERFFNEIRRSGINIRRELEKIRAIERDFGVQPAIYYPEPDPGPAVYEI